MRKMIELTEGIVQKLTSCSHGHTVNIGVAARPLLVTTARNVAILFDAVHDKDVSHAK